MLLGSISETWGTPLGAFEARLWCEAALQALRHRPTSDYLLGVSIGRLHGYAAALAFTHQTAAQRFRAVAIELARLDVEVRRTRRPLCSCVPVEA